MSAFKMMKKTIVRTLVALVAAVPISAVAAVTDADVPVFITIGQSNADGSAMFNPTLDSEFEQWYTSEANTGKMKIWYKSTVVQNQTANALGEAARWAVDGTTVDAEPGWMDLWYKNENTQGRTAMNMIHGYGTWSTGTDTNCAQGRRGMEGAFGRTFATALPASELYILKLGVSGSFISSWANTSDDTNWTYFYEKVFKPAMLDLISKGKRPRLAGVWWMQGCADHLNTQAYYQQSLQRLVDRIHNELGFADGKIYVGHIVKPGESTVTPDGSVQYGQGVRDAQDAIASSYPSVSIVDTKNYSMQYEDSFSGYIHFDHAGVNAIGEELANRVIDDGADNWAIFSTPGQWRQTGNTAIFIPAFGNPDITYATDGDEVTATIAYPGFTDQKIYTLQSQIESSSPGYLEMDGSRYMSIPYSTDFNIAAGGTMTISAKVWLDSYGTHRGIVCNRWHGSTTSNAGTTGFELYGGNSATQSFSNNVNLNKGTWNNIGHVWCNTLGTGSWTHVCWVYDGANGTSKLYIDGVLKDTRTSNDYKSYPINPQTDILVGGRYSIPASGASISMNELWLGKIDDVRFYSKALSDAEVTADMTSSVDESTSDLIAAYDFTDLRGTNCPDISGNGHNGVLVNFPDYSTSGSLLTIEAPASGTGTITVMKGTEQLTSGSRVEDGTELTVTAVPAADYTLESIMVNGTPITGNTFTMNGETTVSAVFVRDASAPTKVLVFDMNEAGSKYYRIPALVTAADGSLVALADRRGDSLGDLPNTISVVAKRSTDGGETWSDAVTIAEGNSATGKTYGDPAVVLDKRTGNLVAVYSGDTGFFVSTKTSRAGFYVSISSDNGVSWTEPRAVTDQLYQSSWYGAFCASGRMLQTESGRIMFVANARLSSQQSLTDVYEYVCASDDGGQTWTVLNKDSRIPSDGQGNESKLVELSDGSLIMSIRSSGKRRFSKSTDGGVTWTAATAVSDLDDPSCNGDIIVYPSTDGQTRMLHSLPANSSVRRDVSVSLSYDEGTSWPIRKKLIDGYSAYSSLTVLPDGTIGCFVEEGKWDSNISGEDGFRLYFMKFTLDWLTNGSDVPVNDPVYDGTLNLDGTRYMIIPNSEEFNIAAGGTMTVSVKAKVNAQATQTFITNRVRNYSDNNNNDVSGWAIYSVESGTTSTSFNYPGSSWTARHHNQTPGITNDDEWHHLCWVYSGTSSAFYIDGVAVSNPPAVNNTAIPSYCDILVGAGYAMSDNKKFSIDDLNNFVNGQIDDVRIYGSALTASEVAQDKSATAPLADKNVIAAYDFAEIKGLSVTDISGNGHTGTLVGFPENAPGCAITLVSANAAQGTYKVYNGETEVLSGRKISAGTVLTVVPEAIPGFMVSEVKVNGVAISPVDGVYSFEVAGDSEIEVLFERDPDAVVDYCIPGGTPSNARYITAFKVSDNEGSEISIQGNGAGGGYTDCNTSVFTTKAGNQVTLQITSGSGEWQHTYLHIDYGQDGVFDYTPGLSEPHGDLVSYNCYNGGDANSGNPWKNSNGETVTNHQYVVGTLPTFTIPGDLAPGIYQARLRLAWNNADACLDLTDVGTETGRACIDFKICIGFDEYDNERTVTVASENETLGTVAITSPETDGLSVTTRQKDVTVKAVPAENFAFLNWTDDNDDVVSTEASYTYNGENDAALTAHFGGQVSYTSGDFGTAEVTVAGESISSDAVVELGTEVTVTVAPADGKECLLTLNGTPVEFEDNTYTFVVESNVDINISFVDRICRLSLVVSGNGSVEVWTAYNEDTREPEGTRIEDGGVIPTDLSVGELVICFIPGNGESVQSVSYTIGDITTPIAADELFDSAYKSDVGKVCTIGTAAITDNLVLSVIFSGETQGIDGIGTDPADGPVEYYNLRGVRVAAENLVPGFYIVRQGEKNMKVLIRR